MTPEQLDQARARYRDAFAALPPPTEERIEEIAALFDEIRLSQARDKARAVDEERRRDGT